MLDLVFTERGSLGCSFPGCSSFRTSLKFKRHFQWTVNPLTKAALPLPAISTVTALRLPAYLNRVAASPLRNPSDSFSAVRW